MDVILGRGGLFACALLATTALTAPACGQATRPHRQADANGVDLTYGDSLASAVEGSVGAGPAELTLARNGVWVASGYNVNGHQWDQIEFHRTPGPGATVTYSVSMYGRSEVFSSTGTLPTGSSLSGGANDFVYRTGDGLSINFNDAGNGGWGTDSNFCTGEVGQGACILIPTSISQSDGRTVSIAYDIWTDCWGEIDSEHLPCHYTPRISTVSNNYGYSISFVYSSGGTGTPPAGWFQRTGATFYRSGTAVGSVSYAYPATGVTAVTDMNGDVWRFTGSIAGLTGIRRPGASSDTTTISYSSGQVSSVARDGVTTSYSRSVSGSTATMTVTDAASHVTTVVSDLTIGRPTSITDPLSRQTQYQYDSYGRLTRVTAPEGNYTSYTYDSRGNITETRRVAKSGSGLADIVTSATYASSCTDASCNEPLTTTDARGHVTDYTYDATHGGVTSVTGPAPSGSGIRPQTRSSYTLDSSSGVYQLTGSSTCQSTDFTGSPPACGSGDEATTAYSYDAYGNLTSTTVAGGGVTATTSMTFDARGNLTDVNRPISGDDDITHYRYNNGRQLVGVIGPNPADPDHTLHHRAQRITYTNGLPTRTETGTVNSQSDSDWTGFTPLEQIDVEYDANARPTRRKVIASSTTYAVTDMSYDALGRPDCVAVRMNPSTWNTATAACTPQTTGSYGDDRIRRTSYDNAGQVTLVQSAYGISGVQADEVASTYRANGQLETVTDAESNRTTYVYDGHDRLSITRFPSATQGAGASNTSDYEQRTYDAGGNVTAIRLRDNTTINFSYDYLNRLSTKDLPGSELDVTYTYDLLGRTTSVYTSAQTLSFTYDALGRNLSQVGPRGTVSYLYDLAGRRTRMTYADAGLYVDYDYDVAGDLLKIRENGATTGAGLLARYVYDDRGRRVSLTRGNGAATSYTFDPADRLTQIAHDLASTTYDLTLSDSYNPANGVVSHTTSNDLYAWGAHYAVNRSYASNGLNQYTTTGSITPTYDGRGNVTSAGTMTYGYSSEDHLISATGGISLTYDPLGRLYQTSGAATARFGYDGGNLIAEYNGSNSLLRRYVFGPNTDEPLVWYEGTGTSTRRWYHADERGSIIATSDGSGAMATQYAYDEHGIPGTTSSDTFRFTGQAWLPDLGMYHFRARTYSPTLGRFLQTDPVGFQGGVNLYAYVGGDPVNFSDPTGAMRICVQVHNAAGPGYHSECVGVDGNNNGSTADNDMSQDQVEAYMANFGGLIAAIGGSSSHPTDLSSYGKDVRGVGSDYDFTMTRVTSQFVGYWAAHNASSDNNVTMNLFRQAWNSIAYINLSNDPHAQSPASLEQLRFTPDHSQIYINISGGFGLGNATSVFRFPSDLARIMFHEPWHVFWQGDVNHAGIDNWARTIVSRYGFGRCHSAGGFPRC